MVELSSCVNMQFTFEIRFYFVPSEITSLEAYRLCEYVVAACLGVRSILAPFWIELDDKQCEKISQVLKASTSPSHLHNK